MFWYNFAVAGATPVVDDTQSGTRQVLASLMPLMNTNMQAADSASLAGRMGLY